MIEPKQSEANARVNCIVLVSSESCCVPLRSNLVIAFAPMGAELPITTFFDSDHAHDRLTRRSCTGILQFVGSMPVMALSRRQGSVETSTYGAEFSAMRTAKRRERNWAAIFSCSGVGVAGADDSCSSLSSLCSMLVSSGFAWMDSALRTASPSDISCDGATMSCIFSSSPSFLLSAILSSAAQSLAESIFALSFFVVLLCFLREESLTRPPPKDLLILDLIDDI